MTESRKTPKSNAPATRLHSLVDEAQLLMGQLVTLSSAQSDAIESGDVAQIVEIVSLRDPVVRGLVGVGEEIGAFIEDSDMIAKVGGNERTEALKRIASIEIAMKHLREQDARDQQQMETVRDAMAQSLSTMGTGQNALRAYSGRPSTPNPILQDRQG